MEKLLLVDGSNLLFQMFYGMPNAIPDKQGIDIRGTIGFLGALRKILQMTRPTHAVVLFDGECTNPRREIDEDYKANRPDYGQMAEEELPFCQLPNIYAALDFLGICHKETENCETDDWIAGYALTCGGQMEVVISSFDSDYFQLISQNVTVLRYRGEASAVWTEETLQQKLGIRPCQYAGFKALTGDHADNIAGVPHVGPKTAAALMGQFGTLEALLNGTAQIKRGRIRDAVEQFAERIRKNDQLIRLDGNATLPFEMKALVWDGKPFSTTEVLREIGLRGEE